jgi:hypothetical protein
VVGDSGNVPADKDDDRHRQGLGQTEGPSPHPGPEKHLQRHRCDDTSAQDEQVLDVTHRGRRAAVGPIMWDAAIADGPASGSFTPNQPTEPPGAGRDRPRTTGVAPDEDRGSVG